MSGRKSVTWDQVGSTSLPDGWDPVPYRLTNGALISCPYDGRQPYIVQPHFVNMDDNVAWATKMRTEYIDFQTVVTAIPAGPDSDPGTAIVGFRAGQAMKFRAAVFQGGQFDYQRPPNTNLFLAFYTSFASYNFGVLGYYAGFTIQHLMEGGGYTNWLHASWDWATHWGTTRMDSSGADGLSRLNEWCVRRAFQDAGQKLIP